MAFAAIAIGALVPAAIMSIAAANTFTRNIYKEWLKKDATPAQEAKVSKLMSLLVKAFALVFVLTLDKQNAINFQLLGGIWILQTFPAVVFSLFTRWFHRYGLLVGWAVGIVYGTVEAYQVVNPVTGSHFGGSLGLIPGMERMGYIAVTAFVINVLLAVVISAILNALKVSNGKDETIAFDYFADADDPRVQKDLAEHDDARRVVRRPGRHPRERSGPLALGKQCRSPGVHWNRDPHPWFRPGDRHRGPSVARPRRPVRRVLHDPGGHDDRVGGDARDPRDLRPARRLGQRRHLGHQRLPPGLRRPDPDHRAAG